MPLIHRDSTHHQDQVIIPASRSAISVSEKKAHKSGQGSSSAPAMDSGRLTPTLNTTPA